MKKSQASGQRNENMVDFDLTTFLPNRLAILSRLTQVVLASSLEKSGLTIAQWRVYLCLMTQGPSTLSSIAEYTHLPQSSLSRSVARMAERQLLRNARNAEDRRLSCIEITEKGQEQLSEAILAVKQNWAKVFESAPIDEGNFLCTVNQLIHHLSTHQE